MVTSGTEIMTSLPFSKYLKRPGVAIFADIIQVVTMFIKIIQEKKKKLQELKVMYQNAIYIYSF